MNKKWECYEVDNKKVKELVDQYGINELLARILVNKNITNKRAMQIALLFISLYIYCNH